MPNYSSLSKLISIIALPAVIMLVACGGGGSVVPPPPPPSLQSIAVSPQAASVAAGLTQQFTATGTFSDGTVKLLTSVTWSTSDPTLATIDTTGLATSLKQGAISVSAASGTVTGSAPFNIGTGIGHRTNDFR